MRLARARKRVGLTQRELAKRCGVSQPQLATIELGKRWPTLPQLSRIARVLGVPLQWFLTGRCRPGLEFRDIAIQLQHLGVVDLLLLDDVPIPGAFRPPEEVVAWSVTGDAPDPRIVEAIPAVLAWNRWNDRLLAAYGRAHDRRSAHRLAWLTDVALTIQRTQGFPGGFVDPLRLSKFKGRIKPPAEPDSLGRVALGDELPPVSRRWNITYSAGVSAFYRRAEHLHSLRAGQEFGRGAAGGPWDD